MHKKWEAEQCDSYNVFSSPPPFGKQKQAWGADSLEIAYNTDFRKDLPQAKK